MPPATEAPPGQRADDHRAAVPDVPTIRRVAASEIPNRPGTVSQPNAVGPAGSTLRPGSVDRATLVGQPSSVERPNTVENSNSVEHSHSVDRPGPGSENAARPLPSSIRRTPSPPINPSHGSGPVASLESPGDGSVPRSRSTRQRGRVLPRGNPRPRYPGAVARRRRWANRHAGAPLYRREPAAPAARWSSDCPVHSPVPARSRRSDRHRLGFPWEPPHPSSSRRVQVRESLRPPATTGYLTARRQRWGLGGSQRRPGVVDSRCYPPRQEKRPGGRWSRRRSILGWAIAGAGARTPTRAPSIAGPSVERAYQDHRRPNRRTRTGALPCHNLSPGMRHHPKPADRRGSLPVRTVAPPPMRVNPRLRWRRPFAGTRP